MKAVILSAGQGRRLLPLTEKSPKCALPVHDRPMIAWQVDALFRCGVEPVAVVVGYGAEEVDRLLAERYGADRVRTVHNPFYAVADNLGSCWVARNEMSEDFVLLNGDTLFDADVLRRLLASPERPVTVATDRKDAYDADDMKVIRAGERLLRVGKELDLDRVNGESIGMILFRGEGPSLFCAAVDRALRRQEALKRWYLSVIDEMAQSLPVWTCSMEGLEWVEVDTPDDLDRAGRMIRAWPRERDRARA